MEYDWRDDPANEDPMHPAYHNVKISQGLTKVVEAAIWDYVPGRYLGLDSDGNPDYDIDDFSNTDWSIECAEETPESLMKESIKVLRSFYDRADKKEKQVIDNLIERLSSWDIDYTEFEDK